jgi:hypothetical protein
MQDRNVPSPALPTHSEDGVDLTLIRWMLSLTPAERLQALQGIIDFVETVHRENG